MRNSVLAANKVICDTPKRMGRRLLYPDKMIAALPPRSFDRMLAVARPDEDKTDFLREAVEAELERREREAKKDA